MVQQRLAHLLLLLVASIYGINYIWAKDVMPQWVQPSAFILLRVSGASLLFLLVRSSKKWTWPERQDLPRIFFSGMLGVAGNQLLFFNGLSLTSPINASIIMTISPMLVVVFGVWAGREVFTQRRIAGFLLAAVGAIGLILIGRGIQSIQSHPLGDVMVLLNASLYAGYLVVVQPLMKKYRAIDVIQWVFFFGWLMVLPFGWKGVTIIEWSALPSLIVWKIAFVVVATTFLVYLMNLYAIAILGSGTVGVYIYLQPLLASAFALMSGAERPHPAQLGFGLMVIGGVLLGSWKKRKT